MRKVVAENDPVRDELKKTETVLFNVLSDVKFSREVWTLKDSVFR